MSDVIEFSKFQDKAKDKEVDKLEEYIYSLYYKVAEGKMSFSDLNKEIIKYMGEHNISQSEFKELELKLIERYGYNPNDLQAAFAGGSIPGSNDVSGIDTNYIKAITNLKGKYGSSIQVSETIKKIIKNDKNDLILYCDKENVFIVSNKQINLEDNEVHEFLVSYRKQLNETTLTIKMGDTLEEFRY